MLRGLSCNLRAGRGGAVQAWSIRGFGCGPGVVYIMLWERGVVWSSCGLHVVYMWSRCGLYYLVGEGGEMGAWSI